MSKGNMEIRKSTREDIKQNYGYFTTAKEYMLHMEIKHKGRWIPW